MTSPFITGITIYPVKSCAGISLNSWSLEDMGLAWDRRFMLANAEGPEKGQLVSQRNCPKMATLTPILDERNHQLLLQGNDGFQVSFGLKDERQVTRPVQVWQNLIPAWDMGKEVGEQLSDYLQQPVNLVRFPMDHQRQVNPDRTGSDTAFTAFADGYPLLVISEASLEDLNGRLEEKGHEAVPMDRFRPNLVVRGLKAFEEDKLSAVILGNKDVSIRMVKPCTRCSMTTIDQMLGEPGPDQGEPLATLAEYRQWSEGGVIFGQNAIVKQTGTITMGDPFTPVL